MKNKIKELALQAGGSHYPEVGGELLQKFANLMLAECIDAVKNSDTKDMVYTTFDNDMVESVKDIAVKSINDRFKE
jgi:hypothetical protein